MRSLLVLAMSIAFCTPSVASAGPVNPPTWLSGYLDESLAISAFVDGSLSYNPRGPASSARLGDDPNRFRAFIPDNGAFLTWIGLDSRLQVGALGFTMDVRGGSGNLRYQGDDVGTALEHFKQLYIDLEVGDFRLELGKFDSTVGAEAADSWVNHAYTRGLLNWLSQPYFHTGGRLWWRTTDALSLHTFVVAGWNTSRDTNDAKSFGGGAKWSVPRLDLSLSYVGGAEQDEDPLRSQNARGANGRLRHLFDGVTVWSPLDVLELCLHVDFGLEEVPAETMHTTKTALWGGASASGRWTVHPHFWVDARIEVFFDADGNRTGVDGLLLQSYTVTFDVVPDPTIIFRLEPRWDRADRPVFFDGVVASALDQLTLTTSLVIRTGG